MIKFSVILPIYNQENQIEYLFDVYKKQLEELGDSWELLFVVNGSRDRSFEKAKEVAGSHPNVKIFNLEQGGWGRAVKFGLENAQGEFLCYTNSARTMPDQLILVLKYARVNSDVVLKTTRVVRDNWKRKFGSMLYNYENRLLLGTQLWDVNGTPKVIPSKFAHNLNLQENGDLIDAEIMTKIHRKNIPIVEVLIIANQRIGGSSTTKLKSALKMYLGVFRLRKELK